MVQRDKLAEENAVLLTNISSLFKTAQMELDRKAKENAELRQKCAAACQVQASETASNPDLVIKLVCLMEGITWLGRRHSIGPLSAFLQGFRFISTSRETVWHHGSAVSGRRSYLSTTLTGYSGLSKPSPGSRPFALQSWRIL